MRALIKWAAVAVTAVLVLGGCLSARASRGEGATTVRSNQIFAD